MRTDPVVIRPGAFVGYMGLEWLYIAAYLELRSGVSLEDFRHSLPSRVEYHHENSGRVRDFAYDSTTSTFTEKTHSDLLVGFYARHLGHAFDQVQAIKNMPEVEGLVDYIIKHTHDVQVELQHLDWQLLKAVRRTGEVSASALARRVGAGESKIQERLDYLQSIPLGFFMGSPHPEDWLANLLLLDFVGTTHADAWPEMARLVGHADVSVAPAFTFRVFTRPERSCAALVPAKDDEQLVALAKEFHSIRGVKVVGAWKFHDIHMTQPWLDAFLDEQISKTGG